ncbi:MAG: 30S ribosomal protein S9 [Planctomycetes bacterium]|jgi:small subunit ribosomal protein S9|nr:30S ribosomal protein S9 [Planctomycetota bacterium]
MAEEKNVQAAETAQAPAAAPREAQSSRTAPPLPEGVHYMWGTGRRKKAIARVRIRPGTGNFLVNAVQMDKYFVTPRDRNSAGAALSVAHMVKSWDIWATVTGGGPTGQAGAVMLGLARALTKAMPELDADLKDKGLLTRDARMKERKKYGQKGARRRFQFSKR